MTSAHLLREARLRAGLTQSELARGCGTTQSAVSRWESGGVEPSLEALQRLIRACGLDLRLELADTSAFDDAQIHENLRLTPADRLDQLVRTVAFIMAGRSALADRVG